MQKFDLISGFFLLAMSAGICIGSLQLDVGTFSAPGSGFFPLITGLSLGLFSTLILVQAKREGKGTVRFWSSKANKKGILSAFVIILIYAMLLERLGFVLTSILFFLLLSRFLSGQSWSRAILFSLVASLVTYGVFRFLLLAPLPQGVLEGVF